MYEVAQVLYVQGIVALGQQVFELRYRIGGEGSDSLIQQSIVFVLSDEAVVKNCLLIAALVQRAPIVQ